MIGISLRGLSGYIGIKYYILESGKKLRSCAMAMELVRWAAIVID